MSNQETWLCAMYVASYLCMYVLYEFQTNYVDQEYLTILRTYPFSYATHSLLSWPKTTVQLDLNLTLASAVHAYIL